MTALYYKEQQRCAKRIQRYVQGITQGAVLHRSRIVVMCLQDFCVSERFIQSYLDHLIEMGELEEDTIGFYATNRQQVVQ